MKKNKGTKDFFMINKPIGLYKRLYKIEQVLKKTSKSRMNITLLVDDGTVDEIKLITRSEVIKRLRVRKNKLKKQLKTLEKKLGPNKMKKIKALAIQELQRIGF